MTSSPGSILRAAALIAALTAACLAPAAEARADAPVPRLQLEPEASTGRTEKTLAVFRKFAITSAHPLASEAGREMLAAGGSAVDAAIAAQLVLGLVEPQSSGLGGGAFLLHWDAAAKALKTYDGRETAPKAAKPDRFLEGGKPMDFDKAVKSGLSVGTPGLVRLLAHTHARHGKLPWARLFEPAIKIARDGFEMPGRLYYMLRWFGAGALSPGARAYFLDTTGSPLPIGHRLKNPDYAATLETLARDGADAFYAGAIPEAIVATVRNAESIPGDLALEDFAAYEVVEREPVCSVYRTYRICGMGPPSSGATTIAQTLSFVERFDLGKGPDAAMGVSAIHLLSEAERLAYADRARYLGDPAFVTVPSGLLDKDYLATRSALIDPAKAMKRAEPGEPPGSDRRAFGIDATNENVGTSHLSVIDAEGNTVALTTTIEGAFGSGLWVNGFLLNNQLTDFSFRPEDDAGNPIANRVEAGKRPRSSMAPTIVFDDKGEVFATLGSPGGSRIILYVLKSLVGLIDWRLDAQAAIDLPNFGSTGGPVELEYGWSAIWRALQLKSYGHDIAPDLMNSGLHALVRRGGVIEAGADPRRDGVSLGE